MNKLKVIILAAGQGTRMKSKIPKVLHRILDKTMIDYVIDTAKYSNAFDIAVIIGHQSAMVKSIIGNRVRFFNQNEQKGTGHAVKQAIDFIGDDENILILYGDTPLITPKTIDKLLKVHLKEKNFATVISSIEENPYGYGRIVRKDGYFKIVEQKDANEEENLIKEINTGVYVFNSNALKTALNSLTNDNSQNEYYLTDTLEIIQNMGHRVGIMKAEEPSDFFGVNSKLQLAKASKIMRTRINEKHMLNGVIIEDPENTYIGVDVEIGEDTTILPGSIIEGKTKIGEECIIGPSTRLTNCKIKDGVIISNSVALNSEIGEYTVVGPFAYVRPNCKIGSHVKIGNFVEVKNSNIKDGTKASHLTYIGDADVGKCVNFGCGTITVNYDGKNKFRTDIQDNSFIGCNSNLIAPVSIKNNAYIAAGSTITKDVPENSLAIGRVKQENKLDWSKNTNSKKN